MRNSSTILDALKKIKDLRDLLANHWRSEFNGVLFEEKAFPIENATLDDVANYYNLLSKGVKNLRNVVTEGENADKNFTYEIDNTKVVTVSAGYYPTSFTITGINSNADLQAAIDTALANLKNELLDKVNTFTAEDVLAGKTVYRLVENENGELDIEEVTGTFGDAGHAVSATGFSEGENPTLIVSGNGTNLATDIPYKSGGTVEITVKTDSKDNSIYEVSGLEEGYYKEGSTVTVNVIDGENIGAINVQSSVNVDGSETVEDGKLVVKPAEGYDYIKKVSVAQGSAVVTANREANVITFDKTVNPGWISDVTLPDTITITPESTANIKVEVVKEGGKDPEIVATVPAGYYADNTEITLKDASGNPIAIITQPTVATDGDDNFKVVVPAGYNDEEKIVNLGKSVLSASNLATTKEFTVSTSEGYTEGESIDVTVKDATVGVEYVPVHTNELGETISGKLEVNTGENNVNAGWITKATVNLNDNLVNSLVTDNIPSLTSDTVDAIVDVKGSEYSITWADFDTEATTTKDLVLEGVYKKVTLNVSGLISEIDSI